ncbi:putative fibrinogen-like protein 1 [Apostichopus japonicus]|uniref:Putative fibrinogen-like protein 1 n=1 Tax=Stichopus japonicus TaxID=307972 RepID=A0A2G8KY43_STIJA|nr:putative fibrinogen-like protein 1 [Apostichopus japonicus]
MIYGTCTCQATCEDPNGQSGCYSDCLGSEGCTCPAGFLMQGSDCISASECGCFVAEANLVIPCPIETARMFMTLTIGKMAYIQSCLLGGLVYHSTYIVKWKTAEDGPCFNVATMASYFDQNWAAYKNGFGDSRNFWLGNEKLHYLTNQRNYKLRFDITTSSGSAKYAEYTEFQVESEKQQLHNE